MDLWLKLLLSKSRIYIKFIWILAITIKIKSCDFRKSHPLIRRILVRFTKRENWSGCFYGFFASDIRSGHFFGEKGFNRNILMLLGENIFIDNMLYFQFAAAYPMLVILMRQSHGVLGWNMQLGMRFHLGILHIVIAMSALDQIRRNNINGRICLILYQIIGGSGGHSFYNVQNWNITNYRAIISNIIYSYSYS